MFVLLFYFIVLHSFIHTLTIANVSRLQYANNAFLVLACSSGSMYCISGKMVSNPIFCKGTVYVFSQSEQDNIFHNKGQ